MLDALTGARIQLRPLLASDGAALIEAAADGELWDLPFTVVPSAETVESYIRVALDGLAAGSVMPFVIKDLKSDRIIGSTRFWNIDRQNRKLEIGHTWLAASWQQTYANTEAKFLMLSFAFEKLGCVRVQFTTDEINEKSRNAILRLGAKQEGVIRHERIMPDGRKRNSVLFSIIDAEWPGIRHTLENMKKRKTSSHLLFTLALAVNTLIIGGLMFGPVCSLPALAQTGAAILAPLPASAPAAAEINAFQEADQKQMPPTGAVLFMGSSSIRMWKTLAQDFSEIPVINRGFGGSLIQDSTLYADRIAIPYKPKIIVLCAGTNDLAYGNKTPQQVFQDYKDFVAKIHTALPDTRIVYLVINPTVARWKQEPRNLEVNYLIEKFSVETNSQTEKLNFIDPHSQLLTADDQPQPQLLQADGLHFNAEGYKVWASLVKPRVMTLAALEGVKRLDALKAAPMLRAIP